MLVGAEPKAEAETQEQVEAPKPPVELVKEPQESVEPKPYASKAEWVDFAVAKGLERVDAEELTKPELVSRFGSEGS